MLDAPPLLRSRTEYLYTVLGRNVERDPRYLIHDADGDGKAETFCNLFVHDVTSDLECPVPYILVNQLEPWLAGARGKFMGWKECDAEEAAVWAEGGFPTIAIWVNPSGPHGHVAMVVPALDGTGLHIAQAGARNFNNAPLARGFGTHVPRFFTHA